MTGADANLVALAVAAPLATAVLALALDGRPAAQRVLSLAGGVLLAGVAGSLVAATAGGAVLVLPLGDWSPLVGIAWAVDRLGATMLALAAVVSLATLAYARAGLREAESRYFHPLHHLVVAGVAGSFVTGDLFNLFVFFEVMLVASFGLIVLGARPRQLRLTLPYVVLNLVASGLFLAGVGAVYGTLGTVNLAELSVRLSGGGGSPAAWAALGLVLVAFGVKAGVLPFFFWLPDAYPESPLPAGAFFAGLLTKVGVYALFRVVPLASPAPGLLQRVLLAVAAATMVVGVLGALGRKSIRAILSFHIVSQVGYMVFALAVFTPLAVAGGIFFIVHQGLVKSAAFLAGGAVERVGGGSDGGGDGGRLGAVRGLATTDRPLAAAFLVPALALAGIPPLSGFWAKVFVLYGGFAAGARVTSAIALVVSLLTLASMLKIWNAAFWGVPDAAAARAARPRGLVGPPLALAALSVVMGLAAPVFFDWSRAAATQLLAREPYIEAVLGATGRPLQARRDRAGPGGTP